MPDIGYISTKTTSKKETTTQRIRRILRENDTYQKDTNIFGSLTNLMKYMSLSAAAPYAGQSLSNTNPVDASLFNQYKGELTSRAVQIAQSQQGVRELSGRNDGAEIRKFLTGSSSANYSDPNANTSGSAWCAGFASWSYKMANDGKNAPWGYDLSVSSIRSKAQNAGFYSSVEQSSLKGGSYAPKQGDLLVLKRNGASHVAIIDKIENGQIYTIEGNYKNSVSSVQRSITDREIDGFVRVDDWTKNQGFSTLS